MASLVDGDLPPQLSPEASYGSTVEARLAGRELLVLPLVHPRQRAVTWTAAHDQWLASVTSA